MLLLLLLLLAAATTASGSPPTLWGAIRWDAFVNSSTDPADPGSVTARVLSPPRWHDRLPWYTAFTPNVTFDDASPDTMDAEIALAVGAGLDHWAFDVYPPDSDLSSALAAYLASASPLKASLFFCLLLQSSWMSSGGLPAWPAKVALYAQHFARPEYRTVLGGRPLLYLFAVEEGAFGGGGGWRDWAAALGALADASLAAGRGAPYTVLQTWGAASGLAQLQAINAAAAAAGRAQPLVHALSSYALLGATEAGTPFQAFADGGEAVWDALAGTGADVVVPVAAGWDPRPRNQTPVPWAPFQDPAFVVMPTPEELGAFVARAKNWTEAHPLANPARCHLISAWKCVGCCCVCVRARARLGRPSAHCTLTPPPPPLLPHSEYDEGHFIGAVLPQFGGNARLEAIGKVLNPQGAQ